MLIHEVLYHRSGTYITIVIMRFGGTTVRENQITNYNLSDFRLAESCVINTTVRNRRYANDSGSGVYRHSARAERIL